jgi:hypothetical protein
MRNVLSILLASYFCFLYGYSPFSASCPICGKELLPNKVASHIRHETNSPKGNIQPECKKKLKFQKIYFQVRKKCDILFFI